MVQITLHDEATRDALVRVHEAVVGETLVLHIEAAVLADRLEYLSGEVSSDGEHFFKADPSVREQMLAIYDASERLRAELPATAAVPS